MKDIYALASELWESSVQPQEPLEPIKHKVRSHYYGPGDRTVLECTGCGWRHVVSDYDFKQDWQLLAHLHRLIAEHEGTANNTRPE